MPVFYKEWFYRGRRALAERIIMKPQPKPMVFAGPGSTLELCNCIARFGVSRLLVVTDKPLMDVGIPQVALNALQNAGVGTLVYDGVLPDPTTTVVDNGIAALEAEGCDGVLAIGGGSSIDAAKVIALASACDRPAKVGATSG